MPVALSKPPPNRLTVQGRSPLAASNSSTDSSYRLRRVGCYATNGPVGPAPAPCAHVRRGPIAGPAHMWGVPFVIAFWSRRPLGGLPSMRPPLQLEP